VQVLELLEKCWNLQMLIQGHLKVLKNGKNTLKMSFALLEQSRQYFNNKIYQFNINQFKKILREIGIVNMKTLNLNQ
jgi:hypothetical protein